MPEDRLLLFGEVKGLCRPSRPSSSFNDVAMRNCQTLPLMHTSWLHVQMLWQLNVITHISCMYISMMPGHLMQHVRWLMFELITAALWLLKLSNYLIVMRKTDCSGQTRLVLHVPSSSWAGKRYHYCYTSLALGSRLSSSCYHCWKP